MKTRSYLILMVTVIIVPVLILGGWGLNQLLKEEREVHIGMVEAKARAIALDIDQDIAHAEGTLKILANSDYLRTGDYASLYALMAKDKELDSWYVLYDYDGKVIINTHSPFGTEFPGIRYDWVSSAIDTGQVSVSNLRTGLVSKTQVVSVNLPIITPSGGKYLISLVYPPSYFSSNVTAQDNPKTWIIGIFGSDGITITRNKKVQDLVGKPVRKELYEASLRQFSGHARYVTRENIAAYTVFTHTERTNWTVAIAVPENEIEAPARNAVAYGALALCLVLGLAVLMVAFLARRLTKGFDEAVAAANVLGRGRVPEVKQTNVAEANLLQSALHGAGVAIGEENQSRLVLEKERERLLSSEQTARKQAEDQNKAKDEFLAMLAHELRNPLAPISAAAQILELVRIDEAMVRQSSEIIQRQVQHMTDLIDDLLDVSRVTRGLVELKKENVDIKSVVSHAIEQVRPLIELRNHELSIHMGPTQAYVHGDKTRLVQVVTNLLNNAAKYTSEGGKITLHVEVQAHQVKIAVTDNGLGIDPALLPHVFDLFRQAQRTPDRSQGGLGLGLALVKSIMALHDGKVDAYSEGLSKGSTFTITLPILTDGTTIINSQRSNDLEVKSSKLFSMMVVDDNLDAAKSLATVLKALGHQVTVEENGKAALKKALENPAQIYILDIGLPDMDGYALAKELRIRKENADAVLIALSGYGQAQDKALSKAAGFDHHFVKPLNIVQLIKVLNLIDDMPIGA